MGFTHEEKPSKDQLFSLKLLVGLMFAMVMLNFFSPRAKEYFHQRKIIKEVNAYIDEMERLV